jgi:hypothetical protein
MPKVRVTDSEISLRTRRAAHLSWANTDDRRARTAPARKAFEDSFSRKADPDGVLSVAERERRAEHLRKAFYAELSRNSAQARRIKKSGGERDSPTQQGS